MSDGNKPDATVYMAKWLEIARALDPVAWDPVTNDQYQQRRILSVCNAQQAIKAERSAPIKESERLRQRPNDSRPAPLAAGKLLAVPQTP